MEELNALLKILANSENPFLTGGTIVGGALAALYFGWSLYNRWKKEAALNGMDMDYLNTSAQMVQLLRDEVRRLHEEVNALREENKELRSELTQLRRQ